LPSLASGRALWLLHWESWGLSSFYEYWTRSRHHQTQIRGSQSSLPCWHASLLTFK
jgi:hypothetical protein